MPSEIERTIEEYRQRVLLQEADQMRVMARRWLEVESSLEATVGLLASEVSEMTAAGEAISMWKVARLERYRRLLAQARSETNRYMEWAADEIGRRQERLIALGIDSAQAAIRASYLDAGRGIGAYFDVLPVEAVQIAIGYASDGTPLNRLLRRDYAKSVAELTRALIEGVTMGRNPRETARAMLEAMSGNLQRALLIARDQQIRTFREASRQQFAASGVVDGYIRRCALNPRTCIACIALDGTEYPTDELMEVHPEDRCFMQPKIAGLEPVVTQSGAEWFAAQSAETQREMLGAGKYDLWKSGEFGLGDFTSRRVDPVWGPSVRVAALGEL